MHFNIRLEEGRQCILVLMGATPEGKKELIAMADGYRESEQTWKELLLDVKARGLQIEPKLAVGDGALGFWKAMRQVWDPTGAAVLGAQDGQRAGQAAQGGAAEGQGGSPRDLAGRDGRGREGVRLFVETYEAKYPKATSAWSRIEKCC